MIFVYNYIKIFLDKTRQRSINTAKQGKLGGSGRNSSHELVCANKHTLQVLPGSLSLVVKADNLKITTDLILVVTWP